MYDSPSNGMFEAIGTVGLIIYVAIIVLIVAAMWKIFTKAGKPGWAAIIPIYNVIVLCEIVGKPAWWVVLYLIPGVNIVIGIWLINLLSKSFGKGVGYTIGIILFPLTLIFLPMLAFGSATYQGPSASQS